MTIRCTDIILQPSPTKPSFPLESWRLVSARLQGWLPSLCPRQDLGSTAPLCQHLDFTSGALSLLSPPSLGLECQCTTLLGAALPVAVTVTSWVTTAWSVGQEESASLATTLCEMPCMTRLLLLGLPHKRRAALCYRATTRGLLTSSSLDGQGVEMLLWT